MSATKSAFLARFDAIWAQARRVQLMQALCWAVLAALAGVALLAAADYWLELPLGLRLAAVVAIVVAAFGVAISLAVESVRRWRRQTTAAAIEKVFPQLGQRIRTTVQFGELSDGQIAHEGVAGSLVVALEEDTIERATPLPLDAVVPWKSLAVASLLAAVVGLGMAGLSAVDWQWRAAAKRAFLADDPYTLIHVEPGNLTLKEGESASLVVQVEGRTSAQVTLFTRRTDKPDAQWEEQKFPLETAEDDSRKSLAEIPLGRARFPQEYKLAAGSAVAGPYKIEVLYPLKVVKIEAAITPPEYTGQPEGISEGGNITGLAGSKVKLSIELDRPATEASIVLTPSGTRQNPDPAPTTLPVVLSEKTLLAEMELDTDLTYEIYAKAADNMQLPENTYRIRVRQDEPPTVWFESPSEALEVHTLAELLMRVRVSDDYGLSRAGIMFEVNNEEEYPLLAEDFAEAAAELKSTGKLSPQTRATLEKVLPLEHFDLTQQDSIMYYAFAEDIKPGAPQRTESDLRFVDIRPFRRNYRLLDADGMGMPGNQGPQLKTLEELIARQRYALNRTIQVQRKIERSGEADVAGIDSLIKFQGEIAKFTRELAEGLEARGIDETELLYQAETAMLGATDSLAAAQYDTAVLQDRDALKYLIEGRNRLQIFIQKNPNRALLAQLRQFDRMQRQKLRRPKSDEQEAREIAERLERLADEEDFVYQSIASMLSGGAGQQPNSSSTGSGQNQRQNQPPMPAENPMPGESQKAEETQTPGESPMPGEAAKPGETPMPGGSGAGDQSPAPAEPRALTREELEDRQLDIAAEAREIEKALARIQGATDLAKERIAAAAQTAEEAAAKLGQGKLDEAKGPSGAASQQFAELAEQVRAILAQEQADRIAAAQQMAADLAREQQDFADRLAQNEGQGGMAQPGDKPMEDRPGVGGNQRPNGEESQMPGLVGANSLEAAQQIADRAATLADVIARASRADTPEDEQAAGKVAELSESMKLPDLASRLAGLPREVAEGKMEDAKANVGDGADRLEATAQQLAALHRSIVSPQVDELARLEARLTQLEGELDQLQAPSQITNWHMQADELLDELKNAGISEEEIEQFQNEMKTAGWSEGLRTGWQWSRNAAGRYAAPGAYLKRLTRLQTSIRDRMQELMLGDLASSRDEPIPPQYQELVDRYYQVLATSGKDKQEARPAPPPTGK